MRLPDPGQAGTLDDLVAALRLLKAWSHDTSYAVITRIVNDRWRRAGRPLSELTRKSTVAGYFAFGRSRLDEELLVAIVLALRTDDEYAERWRHALRAIRAQVTASASAFIDARCDLPSAPEGFIGRHAELRRLANLSGAGGTVLIQGMPGVGKTWLAMHAAHRLLSSSADEFIQLVADLRGFAAEAPPACPSAVLGRFLRHLGLRREQIPRDLAARAEVYRALLRDVRVLVVLDNAADEKTVAPLIPDSPHQNVVITSRVRLTGLRDAAHIHLTALDPAESLDLLRCVVGGTRIDAETAAAGRIAARVGQHPLALSIVGRHLRQHPDWSVGDYARPVTLALAGGVRSALAVSCRGLPAGTRRVLRLLALHPAQDVGYHAVAALLDTDLTTTRGHLRVLVDAHLVRQPSAGRYVLHELVRGYAVELLGLEERASQVRAAMTRLFDYYRRTAAVAVSRLGRDGEEGHPSRRQANLPRVPDAADDPWRWMADEHANLLLMTALAADRGRPGLARDLATALWRYQCAIGAVRPRPRSSEVAHHPARAAHSGLEEFLREEDVPEETA
ncbi:NB-ARC domain-containing protein [Micromonospora sp. NBC_01699]|uniref:NB-ARC domain-containing protein n=1 Tax=Micromonospora sp. NBC_01699 TaxID=2975984 RepID=UPI002E2DECF2|nr:NB-ARC domain-containing protein [Micromonospora sp. NBC_01699]